MRTDFTFASRFPCLAVAALLVLANGLADLPAQTVRCEAMGPITASINFNVQNTIPAGTLTTARTASVSALGVQATTTVTPLADGVRWTAAIIDPATAAFGQVYHTPFSPLMLRFLGSGPGIITVVATGSLVGYGTNSLVVDVGADYTNEVAASNLMAPLRQQFRVCINGELRIQVMVQAYSGGLQSSSHGDSAAMDVTVTFAPLVPSAQIDDYGPTCGPMLTASDTPNGLAHNLRFSVSHPRGIAARVFVFGSARASLPIPGTQCLLQTLPIATVSQPGEGGNGHVRVAVPGPLRGIRIHAQALTLAMPGTLLSSNGLTVRFDDC